MKIFIPLLAAVGALNSGSAMASELPPPTTAIDQLVVGSTTIDWVKSKFGKPNSVMGNSDGTTLLVYSSVSTHVKGTSFIPMVGLFAGGAKSKIIIRQFTFDAAGLLKSYSTTDSAADCSVGLASASCH